MAPKYHSTLSGVDRKALAKELVRARAMTGILSRQADELRAKGEALIREAVTSLAKAGTNGCGPTAGRFIHHRPSIKPSTAAFRGWKSNAAGARQNAMSV